MHKTIEVLSFQKDGVPRDNTKATYKGNITGTKLISLTFCFRFNLFYFHDSATIVKLEDTPSHNDELIVGIVWVDHIRTMLGGLRQFQPLKMNFQTDIWHHLCFLYNDEKHEISSYTDGVLNNREYSKLPGLCYGDLLTLGQGPRVSVDETSLSGQLTQLNIWDKVLESSEIHRIAKCDNDLQGNFVSWDVGWNTYNVESSKMNLQDICDSRDDDQYTYVWTPNLSQALAYYICRAFGGYLPEVSSSNECENLHNLTQKKWPGTQICATKYWTSLTDAAVEGTWVRSYAPNERGKLFWASGEPDGREFQNCALIYYQGMRDVTCQDTHECAMCKVPLSVLFTLKGSCETDKRHTYFHLFQLEVLAFEFRGFGGHVIEHNEDNNWVLREQRNGTVMAELVGSSEYPYYPMGRRKWTLYSEMCSQTTGIRTLLLSPCIKGQFTCDDGSCISLSNRCDLKYDCLDESDELNCQLVRIPKGYQFDLPPRISGLNEESLKISANISIEFITVDTMDMSMVVSNTFQMSWLDYRLMYIDLKAQASLNRLAFSTVQQLWSPSVSFVNTEKGESTIVDSGVTMIITRRMKSIDTDSSVPVEVEIYGGANNPISISRKYATSFTCNFDLTLYPFDDQHCDIRMQITSASMDYLVFDAASSNVTYRGSSLLLEYQMGPLAILTSSEGEFSELHIRVPLYRLFGYALLNIYIPSSILLVISYATLFFRPFIFEVRVMSVLTVLLVTATLFTQVSSSLPKTSYFKMVDVWLLFCIVMNFLMIILHALIDVQLHEQLERGDVSPQVKMAIKVLKRKVHPTPAEAFRDRRFTPSFWGSFSARISYEKLIYFSRLFVLGVFAAFSVCYWGYIFASKY